MLRSHRALLLIILAAGTTAAAAACLADAAAAAEARHYLLDVPARLQYDNGNGYCGEVSIQSLMLRYGVWIPQAAARAAGGGELLLGRNYAQALRRLRAAYYEFAGTGYRAFVAFAKRSLLAGQGVVEVAFYQGGEDDEYDHIMPVAGIRTATPAAGYDPADELYVNSGYGTTAVRRAVGTYSCTAANKKDPVEAGGCVPVGTVWGYAIHGPAYAGIGPRTALSRLSSPAEPGLGRSVTMAATLTISGLTPGKAYVLYEINSLDQVPATAAATIPAAAKATRFTAGAAVRASSVTFASGKPAYFICVAA